MQNKQWLLHRNFPIAARQLENQWLVYSGGDGRTHCFTGVMADVFGLIWHRPDQIFVAEQFLDEFNKFGAERLDLITLEPFIESLANLHLLKFV